MAGWICVIVPETRLSSAVVQSDIACLAVFRFILIYVVLSTSDAQSRADMVQCFSALRVYPLVIKSINPDVVPHNWHPNYFP